ncbi:collagenase-like [Ostrinia furnacalis]|uniref:collagenase-like n=1 Tax=Ostrinia furnacalis TaxID=93504 RepID=UPI00103DDAAA|nr:collagenase-like [Ostrinia furnacalis]
MAALKSFLLLTACAAALAGRAPQAYYHEAEGIPAMARIHAQEQALRDSRISLGIQVPRGTHPYMAGLVIHLVDGRTSMCGAAMLSHTRAATAAHCWWDGRAQARHFTVVYGADSLTVGGLRLLTSDVEMHASFNPLTYANDIAIITHPYVEYNDYINRILVPTGTLQYVDTWAVAVGFGRTTNDPTIAQSFDKRQVMLQVIANLTCRNVWAASLVGNGVLCTSSAGGMSVCAGDSGGPLVIGAGADRTLIGIASFGTDAACGLGFPAGFTRVTSYSAWINARI